MYHIKHMTLHFLCRTWYSEYRMYALTNCVPNTPDHCHTIDMGHILYGTRTLYYVFVELNPNTRLNRNEPIQAYYYDWNIITKRPA